MFHHFPPPSNVFSSSFQQPPIHFLDAQSQAQTHRVGIRQSPAGSAVRFPGDPRFQSHHGALPRNGEFLKDLILHQHLGVSENVVYPEKPNGLADHYPY